MNGTTVEIRHPGPPVHWCRTHNRTEDTGRAHLVCLGCGHVYRSAGALRRSYRVLAARVTWADLIDGPPARASSRHYRTEALIEVRTILDAVAAQVGMIVLLVQWFLYRTASGQPSPAATPVILVAAVLSGPVVLALTSRVSSAIDAGERRWIADGRPAA